MLNIIVYLTIVYLHIPTMKVKLKRKKYPSLFQAFQKEWTFLSKWKLENVPFEVLCDFNNNLGTCTFCFWSPLYRVQNVILKDWFKLSELNGWVFIKMKQFLLYALSTSVIAIITFTIYRYYTWNDKAIASFSCLFATVLWNELFI